MDYNYKPEKKSLSLPIGERTLTLEHNRFITQADGSVTIQLGDTVIMANAGIGNSIDGDFLPLTVDFEERYYAGGKIKGSRFIKREGRPSDDAILTARLIDRSIRPLFPKGLSNEIQVLITPISSEKTFHPGTLALTAASTALLLSGVPFEGPVAGIRIGMVDGQFIIDPTYEQLTEGDLDLVVSGRMDAITMVEAGAKEVPEEKMLEALDFAHEQIKKLCQAQLDLVTQVGAKDLAALGRAVTIRTVDETVKHTLKEVISTTDLDNLYAPTKPEVYKKLHALQDQMLEKYATKISSEAEEDTVWTESEIKNTVDKIFKEHMREKILATGSRLDSRTTDEIRPLYCDTGVLPRPHGTGLFQRGETQVCSFTTLAGPGAEQIIDSMDLDYKKRYIHHYNFPPYSVGEVRRLRGTSRREIGHGFLAERALEPVLPPKEKFPYTMRVVSEVFSCNGSSSMASVCGSTLSLMHAGVPITRPVSGIAMGLVADDAENVNNYKVLFDIQGMEDFAGDMDFKDCGTEKGITALQMDIKIKGMPRTILAEALEKGRQGRMQILEAMTQAIAEPNKELSQYAPLITTLEIKPDDIRVVIGKGGETIQKITEECGVEIDIEDSGLVFVTAPDQTSGQKAVEWIKKLTYTPEVGDTFTGKVVRLMDFGAFVEMTPGKDGLVHISKLAPWRVNQVTDLVKEGDMLKVKLMEIDSQGRYNLSAVDADRNQFEDKRK